MFLEKLKPAPKGTHDFLVSHRSAAVMIEYTTGCNMRCSYCSVSKEGWVSKDLDEDLANRIADEVIARQPDGVMIHGHGETTMLKGWEKKAQKFMDAGVQVSICTNLAKQYTLEELKVLAQLHHMTISLDTIDVQLFKKLRRGGDIRHVIYNMTRVQDLAKRMGKPMSSISWSCVCCDKSIWGLDDLVEYGISLGVNGFTFCNLGASDVPDGGMETKHISELPVEDCKKALKVLERIQHLCRKHNKILDLKVGIIDTLKLKIESGETHWTRPGGYAPV
jgi:hypothetical protein